MGAAINPASGPGIPLELLRIVTPLGIRFWDLTFNLPINDGLTVNLWLANSPGPILTAVPTTSGVYAFFGLPGLHAVEYPNGGFGPPRTFTYVVTVQDQFGLYLPAVLVYTLDQTGAVLVNGVPDTTPGPRLAYLFSAPTRQATPGVAAVSAYLIDQGSSPPATDTPAAWALVTIQVGNDPETWTGIADESGRALVLVPYPVVQRLQFGSPPGSGQGSITGETWPLTVQVQYSPDKLGHPLANAGDVVWPWTTTPNLKDILESQQPATIWADPATPVTKFQATLTLGQDLVLRSAALSPLSLSSSLNISRS
jgi:hypothetical protein